MSINAFSDWAKAEGLEEFGDLKELNGTILAIDAEEYLNSLLTTTETREPLLPALGGLPFALQKHIDDVLQNLRDAGIDPLFVFNGLDLAVKDKAQYRKESNRAAKSLDDAWTIYDQERPEEAVAAFGRPACCTYKTQHIVRWLKSYLHRSGAAIQVAPYNAAAQMVSLLNAEKDSSRVDGVYGSASLLVYGADQVITRFDFKEKKLHWVQLDKCLEKLVLQPEQFNDLMLLAGYSTLPPIPEIDLDTVPSKIAAARNILNRANMNGYTACLQSKDEDYTSAYQKAIYAIKHAVTCNEQGLVEPKDNKNVPVDLHEFIGQQLPQELYTPYMISGVVGPRVVEWRTRLQILECPPLDGGSSNPYRDLVQTKLAPIRVQTLALFSRHMHRWYLKTDVNLSCWFKEDEKRALGIPDAINNEPSASADTWHVKEAAMVGEQGADLFTSPLRFALNILSDEATAKNTVTPLGKDQPPKAILQTEKEVLANTVWRFLHDRGYINPDHTLSAWGKAVKAALDQAQKNEYPSTGSLSNEAEEAILMAFELLRLDLLSSKTMFSSPPYFGLPHRGNDTDKANTLLISRIASLATLKHRSIGYTGPLSRHLLAYHQMAAAVRNSLRDLIEVHFCNMAFSEVVNRRLEVTQLTNIASGFPFTREPDLGLALAVKSYLDELSNDPGKRVNLAEWFPQAIDVHSDLEKAWKLWSAINTGIQSADSSIVNNETRKLFKNADEWLQRKRQSAPTTNGTA